MLPLGFWVWVPAEADLEIKIGVEVLYLEGGLRAS